MRGCSLSRVCSPSWCSVWVLASEARTTHLQLLRSGLPNSRIPRPVRLFFLRASCVLFHCASYTDYRPIFRKTVLWQAQHHSYAVGHFKHCSSYGFFLPSSTFLISDRKCRVFPRCSFQYDRTYMPGCQAMLFGFSQSVEVEGPFKSGHHLC